VLIFSLVVSLFIVRNANRNAGAVCGQFLLVFQGQYTIGVNMETDLRIV
jgi:hypothetical protein